MPDRAIRKEMIINYLIDEKHHSLTFEDLNLISGKTVGFSGSDLVFLVQEASYVRTRTMTDEQLYTLKPEQLRSISYGDFLIALETVKPSVTTKDIERHYKWNERYGNIRTLCRD